MELTDQQRNLIRTAVLAGRRANPTDANRIILPTGNAASRTYSILSGHDGVLTAAGEYYYHMTREPRPDGTFDYNQVPIRRGDTELARDRSGREVRLRTLQANGQYTYSALGRIFFSRRQVEHVVHILVIIEGTRRNWTNHE